MRWSTFSTPLVVCISSAIALSHVAYALETQPDQVRVQVPETDTSATPGAVTNDQVTLGVDSIHAGAILNPILSPTYRNPVYSTGRSDAQLSPHDRQPEKQQQEEQKKQPQLQEEKKAAKTSKSSSSAREKLLEALDDQEKEALQGYFSPDELEDLLSNPRWDIDMDGRIAKLKQWIANRPKEKLAQQSSTTNSNIDDDDSFYTPVRHDVRPQPSSDDASDDASGTGGSYGNYVPTYPSLSDPCYRASRGLGGPVSYEIVVACLDTNFPFPDRLRQDTISTMKNLISNFYVYEDLAAHPPTTGNGNEWLSFTPVELIKELDRHFVLSGGSVSRNGDDEEDDEDDDEEDDEKDKKTDKKGVDEVDDQDDDEDKNGDRGDSKADHDIDDERDEIATDKKASTPKKGKRFVKLESLKSKKFNSKKEGTFQAAAEPDVPHDMTHREFHDGLTQILGKARDGHLSYDADCFRAFRWQQGIFISHVVRDGKVVLKVHSVTPYFQKVNGVKEDLLNCDVISIEGQDAAQYIQSWADTHVSVSKDANIRFNSALASPQYRSGTTDFFLPGKFGERFITPEKGSLLHVFRCPGLPRDLTVDIKWVGLYTREVTKPFHDTVSFYEANCIKARRFFDAGGGGNEEDQLQRLEKEQDPIQRNITILKAAIRELLLRPAPVTADLPSSNAVKMVTPTQESATTPVTRPSPMVVVDSKIPEELRNKNIDELLDELDLLSSEQLPVVKYYDDYGGRPSEMPRGDSVQFQELYKGAHGISALLLDDGETGVITVRTESSTNKGQPYAQVHPAWSGALIKSINVLRPRAKKLILDLSHNTGGYVCLGLTLVQIFFPERPRLVTNIRLSPLGTHMMTSGAMGVDHFISSYGNTTIPAYQNGDLLKPVVHPNRNITFTDFVSDRCSITERYFLHWNAADEKRRGRAAYVNSSNVVYHPWDPQDIVILTDGYCGSSCALITNLLNMKFGIKTVVVGGHASADCGVPMGYSTFPGLQVIDDSLIFNEMHEVRAGMMSRRELDRLEQGHVEKQRQQTAFLVKNQERNEEEEVVVEDDKETQGTPQQSKKTRVPASAPQSNNGHQTPATSAVYDDDTEYEDEEEDQDDSDPDSFYPLPFAQKSRLRLTWRQIYNTGKHINVFKHDRTTVLPLERWNEFSFFPADVRIDYTDHNIHSIGTVWEDARDAVWGPSESSGVVVEKDQEDVDQTVQPLPKPTEEDEAEEQDDEEEEEDDDREDEDDQEDENEEDKEDEEDEDDGDDDDDDDDDDDEEAEALG
ncbi:hypothetical protein BGZ83_007366 [Gryganskiella cystojenkinii]|nr:hypothetical protein BGZ83_007366 [Gryganskiella cystojenkinii]